MLFPQEDAEAVKQWLITELAPLCDADPDVLAEYVLALFKYDTGEQELLSMMNEQLVDFLEGETEGFVNKAYETLKSGGYRNDARKRSAENDDEELEDAEAPAKRQAYAEETPHNDHIVDEMPDNPEGMPMSDAPIHIVGPMPNFPPLPPPDVMWGPEQMAMAMEHMQQMVASGQLPEGMPMPPFPPMPPMLAGRGGRGMRGRGRGRGGRGAFPGRSGPPARSQDTLVIENIPTENLNLANVNDYFKRFGTITNIDVDEPNSRAVVSYATHEEAENAHKNPDVIFGNRFVKVYFQRLEPQGRPTKPLPSKTNYMTDEGSNKYIAPELRAEAPRVQPGDIERRKLLELRKKKQTLLNMQIAEQKSLLEKLENKDLTPQGRKSIMAMLDKLSTEIKSATETLKQDMQRENATTEELQAKLASLRQEAASLGLDAAGNARGRGRGRGMPFRGRGASFNRSFTLDNRTTRVGISQLPSEYDPEKLKSHMEQFGELQSLDRDGDRLVAHFKTRASGEKAMRSGATVPDMGPVQLEWVEAPVMSTTPMPSAPESLEQAHLESERENWKR
ncbi:hypothetical protein MOBT1_001130 [Malassezia obtusa]|uniref:RRM domain-containing protein n=1 Tax=Malassezia obtusa TaxID=76774 RepID=A0AAF0IRH4_9BASI|nr:hypothetical protein MOBT1_001130 [Malassezia obtusa]